MEEDELLSLCQAKVQKPFQLIPSPFWTAELYSFGRMIREYGFYPAFLPLCVYTDHGARRTDFPAKHELESGAPVQFYHSPQSVANWKKVTDKSCYCYFSPAVYYRRKYKIEQAKDARGTIAFPAHTTPAMDDESDVSKYIDQLYALPEEFQPVSVCLHMHDINKGLHKVFQKRGLKVYTAGNTSDYRFVERFYSILRNFKYSTSNMFATYSYYSVEMGIPFSLYGTPPVFINKEDPNIPFGVYDPYKEFPTYREMFHLFDGLFTTVTDEQKEVVSVDLGLRDGISRRKMCCLLYFSLVKWCSSLKGMKYSLRVSRDRFLSLINSKK